MPKETAKAKVESLLPSLMQQYAGNVSNLRYAWRGDVLEFSGRILVIDVKGTLRVTEADIVLDLDGVPLLFRGKARSGIERWFVDNWPG